MRMRKVSSPFRITQALNGDSVGPAVRRNLKTPSGHRLAARHRAAEHAALAVEVLGGRMHDDVRAELQRTLQRRRAEAVIHREQHACLRAIAATPAMSMTSVSGLDGVSVKNSRPGA